MSESPEPASAAPAPVQFRLVHVFYAMAELGACLAVFGGCGLFFGLVILASWGYVFNSRSRPRSLLNACAAALVGFCLISLLLPAIQNAREAERRPQCGNNLKQILIALQNYHDVYGKFPPACIRDKEGKPMHSWRVLILPFLEQEPLYKQYRFDEPWDGPNNRRLADQLGWPIYVCPSDPRASGQKSPCTSYVAVVGARTVWAGDRSRRLSEIPDGSSDTVMAVEYCGGQISWMEPRDLELNEALRVLTSTEPEAWGPHRPDDFFYEYAGGRQVGFVDCSVRFVCDGMSRDVWSALLVVDDGAGFSDLDLQASGNIAPRPKLGNWFRLAAFVLLTLWPLPWVWRKPQTQPEEATGSPAA